jgi:predicted nucleic-acid-binding Zn-ribbon protein
LPFHLYVMKETNICPKCKSTDVIRVKAYSGTSTSNLVQLSKWGTQFGFYDRYVCTQCGFMEHYANLDGKGWQKWLEEKREEKSLDSDFV